MRILDEEGKEVDNPNLEEGYLTDETIIIAHHDEVPGSLGKFHYETVREYPNGGKDVEKVWDEAPIPYKEAYDETESVQVYHKFSEAEIQRRKEIKEEEIKENSALKRWKLEEMITQAIEKQKEINKKESARVDKIYSDVEENTEIVNNLMTNQKYEVKDGKAVLAGNTELILQRALTKGVYGIISNDEVIAKTTGDVIFDSEKSSQLVLDSDSVVSFFATNDTDSIKTIMVKIIRL